MVVEPVALTTPTSNSQSTTGKTSDVTPSTTDAVKTPVVAKDAGTAPAGTTPAVAAGTATGVAVAKKSAANKKGATAKKAHGALLSSEMANAKDSSDHAAPAAVPAAAPKKVVVKKGLLRRLKPVLGL